jgi:hypothetical protein
MEAAGVLTGSFYSYGDIPTKGCFIKENSMFFGTGGTADEMYTSDLDGVQQRVWCDATSSNTAKSGNGGMCLTEDQCKEKFTMMKNANVIDGYFSADSDFPTKGCFMKGENVYFGIGDISEMTGSDLPGEQKRLLCDGTSDIPKTSSIEDGGGESKGFWSLWTIIGVTLGAAATLIILIIGLKRYKKKG